MYAGGVSYFNAGNVLIGSTTDAGYKLDVNGTGRFTGALSGTSATFSGSVIVGTTALLNFGPTTSFVGMSGNNSTGSLALYANNTQVLGFAASTGAATFSSSVDAVGGYSVSRNGSNSVQQGFLMGTASGTLYLSNFQLNTSGGLDTWTYNATSGWVNRMTLTTSGNVGIGTTSPNSPLEVYGQTRVSASGGSVFLITPNATSTNGIVLESSYYGSAGYGPMNFNTGGTERMRITSGGNLLVGTTTSSASVFKLQVGDGTTDSRAYFNPSNAYALAVANSGGNAYYLGVGTSGTSGSFQIYSTATGTANLTITSGGVVQIANLAGTGSRAVLADASGNLSAPVSDISVKQNIKPIGYGLTEILKMNPVWFDFIDEYKNYGEGRQNGNIAQEMEAIIPEAVFTTPSTGKMGINYDQLHAVYIKAIQELKAQIEELKNKLNNV